MSIYTNVSYTPVLQDNDCEKCVNFIHDANSPIDVISLFDKGIPGFCS